MEKKIRFTDHSEKSLSERLIEKTIVEKAITFPDSISEGYENRKVFSKKYFDADLSQEMFLRIIVEESLDERIVITVYKTSRLDRYNKEKREL